jgi:hypothetical protein
VGASWAKVLLREEENLDVVIASDTIVLGTYNTKLSGKNKQMDLLKTSYTRGHLRTFDEYLL